MGRRSKRLDFVERICKYAGILHRDETLVYEGVPNRYLVGKVKSGKVDLSFAKTIFVYADKVKNGYAIRIKQPRSNWESNVGSEVAKVFNPKYVKVTQRSYTKSFGTLKINVLQLNARHLLW